MARRIEKRGTARVEDDEPICDCAEEHRVAVHLDSVDGTPAIANLCARCGRIHHLPSNARIRTRHDEDTETERRLERVLAADRANLERLREEMHALYQRIEAERETLMKRVAQFRRRYPQPPETPSAHYRDALQQYQDDIERLRELEMAESHASETLGMLGMMEDEDPDQFERVRQLAGMPSLAPSTNPTPSAAETTDSQARDAPSSSHRSTP